VPESVKSTARSGTSKKPILQSYIPSDRGADKALNRAYAELRGPHAN
jgi:hypothetical protein